MIISEDRKSTQRTVRTDDGKECIFLNGSFTSTSASFTFEIVNKEAVLANPSGAQAAVTDFLTGLNSKLAEEGNLQIR